jgi:predicted kinase
MEAILFCGIQATGKSSFYKEKFFHTHVRISMDLLKTRNRESRFIDLCIETQQGFVVDNTNPSKADREKYITRIKEAKYKLIGYYFQSKIEESLARNESRHGKQRIPDVGLRATYSTLELPSYEEGFDELYYVELNNGSFIVKDWNDEV